MKKPVSVWRGCMFIGFFQVVPVVWLPGPGTGGFSLGGAQVNERRFSDRMLGRTSHKEDPSAVIPNYLFPSQSRERTNRRAEILPWICLAACIGALCFSFLCYLEVSSSRDALYDGAFELAKRNARLQFEAEQLRRENSELRFHASLYQIEHGIRPKEDDALRPIESLLSIGGQGRARRRE